MSGNAFLIRAKETIVDRDLLSKESDIKKVGFRTSLKYTTVQVRDGFICLMPRLFFVCFAIRHEALRSGEPHFQHRKGTA